MRKIFVVVLVIFSLISVVTAQDDISTFQSEDGAVIFEYPDYWRLENQEFIFGELYRYEFQTTDQSSILINLINRNQVAYENLDTPIEFFEEATQISIGSPIILSREELTLLNSSAIRVEVLINDDEIIVFYSIVLEPDWIMLVTVQGVEENFAPEEDAVFILESLAFDTQLATIDLNSYPADWMMIDNSYISNDNHDAVKYIDFVFDDIELRIEVTDVTDGEVNRPFNQDTPYEYLYFLRSSDNELDISEILLNDNSTVMVRNALSNDSSQLLITYAHGRRHVISIQATVADNEQLQAIEPILLATLSTLEFVIGAPYIRNPLINLHLPDNWEVSSTQTTENQYYEFVLRQSINQVVGRPIAILYLQTWDYYFFNGIPPHDNVSELIYSSFFTEDIVVTEFQVNEYQAYQSERVTVNGVTGLITLQSTIIVLNDTWFLYIQAVSSSERGTELIYDDVNTIIENMVITLPED